MPIDVLSQTEGLPSHPAWLSVFSTCLSSDAPSASVQTIVLFPFRPDVACERTSRHALSSLNFSAQIPRVEPGRGAI